jgi:hypothetical protein
MDGRRPRSNVLVTIETFPARCRGSELSLYTRDMLLRDADVFNMASSLALRIPLLDDRVVDVVGRPRGPWRNGHSHSKALLSDAAGARFPKAVAGKRKRGFRLSLGWLASRPAA